MENIDTSLYDRAYQSALRVHYLLEGDDDLSSHAKRTARSVAAAIAVAGSEAVSFESSLDDLEDAARYAEELLVHLDFCRDLDRIDAEAVRSLKAEYEEIIGILVSSLEVPDDIWDYEDDAEP